jgi:hypothetical protein
MKKVTKISEMISFLNLVKEEYGDLTVTLNYETIDFNNTGSIYLGDDDVFLNIIARDKDTDPNPDEEETVLSIQNYEKEI